MNSKNLMINFVTLRTGRTRVHSVCAGKENANGYLQLVKNKSLYLPDDSHGPDNKFGETNVE